MSSIFNLHRPLFLSPIALGICGFFVLLFTGDHARPFQPVESDIFRLIEEEPSRAAIQRLDERESLARCCRARGETPLHVAVKHGRFAIVRRLLDCPIDVNACGRGASATPLVLAAQTSADLLEFESPSAAKLNAKEQAHRAAIIMARLLLDHGADPNVVSASGSPLKSAIYSKNVKLVELLLNRGANPNLRDSRGETALFVAVEVGPEYVKRLIESGADLEPKNHRGSTPVSRLLAGSNVIGSISNDQAIARKTLALLSTKPLKHFASAIAVGDLQRIDQLAKAELEKPNQTHTESDPSPITLAIRCNQKAVLKKLLAFGFDPNDKAALRASLFSVDGNMRLKPRLELLKILLEAQKSTKQQAKGYDLRSELLAEHSRWERPSLRSRTNNANPNYHFNAAQQLLLDYGAWPPQENLGLRSINQLWWTEKLRTVPPSVLRIGNIDHYPGGQQQWEFGEWYCALGNQDGQLAVEIEFNSIVSRYRISIPKPRDNQTIRCEVTDFIQNEMHTTTYTSRDDFLLQEPAAFRRFTTYLETAKQIAKTGYPGQRACSFYVCGPSFRQRMSRSTRAGKMLFDQRIRWAILRSDETTVKKLIAAPEFATSNHNAESLLCYAAENGDIQMAQLLLNAGQTLNPKPKPGYHWPAPLHVAACHGHLELAQLFIKRGAKIDATWNGYTPLGVAAANGHLDVVDFLLNQGANRHGNEDAVAQFVAERKNRQPYLARRSLLADPTPLVVAVAARRMRIVKRLVETPPTAEELERAFNMAISLGHQDLAEFLVQQGAYRVIKDKDRQNPQLVSKALTRLIAPHRIAADSGLGRFARVKEYLTLDTVGSLRAAAISAMKNGRLKILTLLADAGLSFVATDQYARVFREPLILYPLEYPDLEVFEHVVQITGAKLRFGKANTTLVHEAAWRQPPTEFISLLVRKGCDLNAKDKNDKTPAHYAAINRRIDVLEHLIKLNANLDIQSNDGNTPLHLAMATRAHNAAALLLRANVNPWLKNAEGETPFELAIRFGCEKTFAEFHKSIPADMFGPELEVFKAISQRDKRKVQSLIQANPKLLQATFLSDKRTPLHHAISLRQIDIAKWLIAQGANVNARTEKGDVPLHTACRNAAEFQSSAKKIGFMSRRIPSKKEEAREVVAQLIARMTDINSMNDAKQTPFDLAIKHQQFIRLIEAADGKPGRRLGP